MKGTERDTFKYKGDKEREKEGVVKERPSSKSGDPWDGDPSQMLILILINKNNA